MDSFELSTDSYNPSELRRSEHRRPLQPSDSERPKLEDIDSPKLPLVPDDSDFTSPAETETDKPQNAGRHPARRRRVAGQRVQQPVEVEESATTANHTANNTEAAAHQAAAHHTSLNDLRKQAAANIPGVIPSIKNVFADGRLAIFLGVILILFAAYLIVASISYIANISTDQSLVVNSSADLIKGRAASIDNTAGWVGAFLSHFLVYRWLGIGSFIIIFYVGAIGLSLVKLCRVRFWQFTFKALVSAVAVSLIAGLLTYNSASPDFWGGEHGYFINMTLIDNASWWSAIAVAVAMITALILIFVQPLAFVCRKLGAFASHVRAQWARRHNEAIEAAHRTEVRRQAERAAARTRAEEQLHRQELKAEAERKYEERARELADSPDEVINVAATPTPSPQTVATPSVERTSPQPLEVKTDVAVTESHTPQPKPAPLDEIYTPLTPGVPSHFVADSETITAPIAESNETEEPERERHTDEPVIALEEFDTPIQLLEEVGPEKTADAADAAGEPETELSSPILSLTVSDAPAESISLDADDAKTTGNTDFPPMTINLPRAVGQSDVDDEIDTESESDVPLGENTIDTANYDPRADLSHYRFPTLDLLNDIQDEGPAVDEEEQEANKQRITNILLSYGVEIASITATIGPTITLYEIVPAPGVRIAKIKRLGDDVALNLAAMGIRIIAPMPGKGTIGMEVPNKKARVVSMRSILSSAAYRESKAQLPIALGTTISNDVYVTDLAKMPHLLVAGATGMGKSVGLNTIIASLLYSKHPAELKFVLVDPKMVEFSLYRCIERHYLAKLPEEDSAIITQPENVVATLNSLCKEMDDRYLLLSEAGVRGLVEYNQKFVQRRLNPEKGHRFLPYIVVVIDEFADLILTVGKDVETPISRLAAKARAIGIHVILATQRPSVNVITGVIKANFPSRMAFRVTQRNDSQTILDRPGAEQLIGRGDMLISRNGIIDRVQCAFIDTPEVEDICNHIAAQQAYPSAYELPELLMASEGGAGAGALTDRDPLFAEAGREVIAQGVGSTSSLQRKFTIGYPRAGKIMDQLEIAGVVGPTQGGKPRAVLMDMYSFERYLES